MCYSRSSGKIRGAEYIEPGTQRIFHGVNIVGDWEFGEIIKGKPNNPKFYPWRGKVDADFNVTELERRLSMDIWRDEIRFGLEPDFPVNIGIADGDLVRLVCYHANKYALVCCWDTEDREIDFMKYIPGADKYDMINGILDGIVTLFYESRDESELVYKRFSPWAKEVAHPVWVTWYDNRGQCIDYNW